jgi:hypothetical protein
LSIHIADAGYISLRYWKESPGGINNLTFPKNESTGAVSVAKLSGGGAASQGPISHAASLIGTGTATDPLAVANPNYETTFRCNDIKANDYIDIKMTFVKWEPLTIVISGVNRFEAYGRWNDADSSLGMTAPTGMEVTPLGGGSIRIRNTGTGTWYGNLVKVTYMPSVVQLTRNTPA